MVTFRSFMGKVAAYVGYLSQLSIDANKNWMDKRITNVKNMSQYSFGIVVSDNLRHSADTQRSAKVFTPMKVKEIEITTPADAAFSLRIKFSIWITWADRLAYGQIYRNGVAVGTLRSTSSTSPVEFSEDVGGWNTDDLIQLYYYCNGNGQPFTHQALNFRIYYDTTITEAEPDIETPSADIIMN